MTNRERFFATAEGRMPDRVPYFPDLSTWYVPRRTPAGAPHTYNAGELIPDADEAFHHQSGALPMPAWCRDWTYLDFYRRFDWGVPVHLYDWYAVEYDGAEETVAVEATRKTRRWRAPEGELTMVYDLAQDGSWCPTRLPVAGPRDLEVCRAITARMRYVPRYHRIREILAEIGDRGVLDLVVRRSPFGKLVHELMGFENLVYALHDDPGPILEWMEFQEISDLELIRLAAAAPEARVVILSDHSDENLISPQQYRQFCIPYYQKITAILHAAGKLVSTHLDGNFRGYMPFLPQTGFDILDGCTPAPMTNWTPHQLAALARSANLTCWCGVPSTLFCQGLADREVLAAGREILHAFAGGPRLILNVGDIVSPTADIAQVIKLGSMAGNPLATEAFASGTKDRAHCG